jgi:hypothetical protein
MFVVTKGILSHSLQVMCTEECTRSEEDENCVVNVDDVLPSCWFVCLFAFNFSLLSTATKHPHAHCVWRMQKNRKE